MVSSVASPYASTIEFEGTLDFTMVTASFASRLATTQKAVAGCPPTKSGVSTRTKMPLAIANSPPSRPPDGATKLVEVAVQHPLPVQAFDTQVIHHLLGLPHIA